MSESNQTPSRRGFLGMAALAAASSAAVAAPASAAPDSAKEPRTPRPWENKTPEEIAKSVRIANGRANVGILCIVGGIEQLLDQVKDWLREHKSSCECEFCTSDDWTLKEARTDLQGLRWVLHNAEGLLTSSVLRPDDEALESLGLEPSGAGDSYGLVEKA
jgi:hypothetical protein